MVHFREETPTSAVYRSNPNMKLWKIIHFQLSASVHFSSFRFICDGNNVIAAGEVSIINTHKAQTGNSSTFGLKGAQRK